MKKPKTVTPKEANAAPGRPVSAPVLRKADWRQVSNAALDRLLIVHGHLFDLYKAWRDECKAEAVESIWRSW